MPIPWRPAECLLKLRDQVKARYPGTPNPGFIGDADHASRTSDHNPWVDDPTGSRNVVTAGDWYNDPEAGFSSRDFAEALKRAKDPRVKYVISDGRIWSLARDAEGWRTYYGPNPHKGHTHVSVSSTKSLYDNTRAWVITLPSAPKDDDDMPLSQDDKNWIDANGQKWAKATNNFTRQTVAAATRAVITADAATDKAEADRIIARLDAKAAELSAKILADAESEGQ